MKLYKITAKQDEQIVRQWAGSQSEAGKIRKELNSAQGFKRDNITTDEVEVPTNKAGLIDFLNAL